jgi:hypothetical protein
MTAPTSADEQGFQLALPPGFIELPARRADPAGLVEDEVRRVRRELRALLGESIDEDDDGLAVVTAVLCMFGVAAADGGVEFAAAGLMRSPQTNRPVLVQLTALRVDSNQAAEAALTDIAKSQRPGGSVRTVGLPAGRAVEVVKDISNTVTLDGQTQTITQRQATVWLPDPTGRVVAIVSVSSANLDDWPHIVELANDVFASVEWDVPGRGAL